MRGETFSGISRCRQVGVTDVVDGSPHTSGGSLGPLAPHPHILVMFTSTCLNTNICCAVEAPQQEYLVYCNRMAGRMHRCRSLVFSVRQTLKFGKGWPVLQTTAEVQHGFLCRMVVSAVGAANTGMQLRR